MRLSASGGCGPLCRPRRHPSLWAPSGLQPAHWLLSCGSVRL